MFVTYAANIFITRPISFATAAFAELKRTNSNVLYAQKLSKLMHTIQHTEITPVSYNVPNVASNMATPDRSIIIWNVYIFLKVPRNKVPSKHDRNGP